MFSICNSIIVHWNVRGNMFCVQKLWLKITVLTSGPAHNFSAKLPANRYGNRNTIGNRNGKLKTERAMRDIK